jgi:hypothetical protein
VHSTPVIDIDEALITIKIEIIVHKQDVAS